MSNNALYRERIHEVFIIRATQLYHTKYIQPPEFAPATLLLCKKYVKLYTECKNHNVLSGRLVLYKKYTKKYTFGTHFGSKLIPHSGSNLT